MRLELAVWAIVLAVVPAPMHAQDAARDWTTVESMLGRKGAPQPGGVMRFNFPRTDLTVKVGDVTLKPAFALGGWVAFLEGNGGVVTAMGDLVLTDDEVAPVMRALQAGGIEQSALHNHVLNEAPHVMYMHLSAHGDRNAIARTLKDALGKTGVPKSPPPSAPAPATIELDTAAIAGILGVTGRLNGIVYQVSVPRKERITEMGVEIPPSMGVGTAINFQPTGSGRAAITGDFVLLGGEVNPVIRALLGAGIEVTALHSHLVDEQPRLYFMHFFANDDQKKLAAGLRAALDILKK